ncbi:MAG: methyltransferase domain-containing protein [Nitrospina sp.]|nr:methyltransferase domain-containing protein [Nitrospina sp.]
MLNWAENHIGENWQKVLADGYLHFLIDVNRSQVEYERRGNYLNKSYSDVFNRVYNNSEFMEFYHWGVFVSTFAWEHHIKIYDLYRNSFLPCLNPEGGCLLDLGSGSGIWSFLTTYFSPKWISQGIDISEKSVELSTKMALSSGLNTKVAFKTYDALKYKGNKKYNAAISCFLMEHLEKPQLLLQNMASNLETKGYAFITAALTAAEIDHISEFHRESEIVLMAEEAGFRVISMYSAAPPSHPDSYRFLPRSLALILQKRKNDIW